MAIPGISLESDVLGQGQMATAIFGTTHVDGCGNRPRWGREARRQYEDCIKRQQELIGRSIDQRAGMGTRSASAGNNTVMFIIVAVVLVALIYFLFKKK